MARSTNKFVKYSLQILNYAVIMAVVWYFSVAPAYQHIQADQALVVVAFNHAGQPLKECQRVSQEELAKLPPNMRKPTVCSRERSPVSLEVLMDGKVLFQSIENAPGLYSDGAVNIFHSTKVPVGKHHFDLKLNDSVRSKGFAYTSKLDKILSPAQVLVINFNTEQGFVIK